MSTVGERNRNPGNIVWTGKVLFPGELGEGEKGFARFDTDENGIRAIALNLFSYQDRHGLNTVAQMIRRWSTTDQNAYVRNVAAAVGVAEDGPINVHDPATLRAMVTAIIRQENGEQPYGDAQIDAALGIEHIDVQPPAPIEDKSTEADAATKDAAQETTVADDTQEPFVGVLKAGASILTAFNPLVGSIAQVLINAFAPLAQEKIANAINKHTDNPEVGQQVAQSVVAGAIALTNKQDPIAAMDAVRNDPALVQQLQASTLDFLDKIAPVLDKLSQYSKDEWAAEQSGRDAAAARAKGEPWDMTRVVVWFAGVTTSVMVFGILATLLWQVLHDKEPSTALIGLGGPLFMAAVAAWKDIFAYRFDGTKDSAAKDAVLGQLAQAGK